MTNSYFKVVVTKKDERCFFFDKRDDRSVRQAWLGAVSLAANVHQYSDARAAEHVSVWTRPEMIGAWDVAKKIGETTNAGLEVVPS
jgi:hypothetical protein